MAAKQIAKDTNDQLINIVDCIHNDCYYDRGIESCCSDNCYHPVTSWVRRSSPLSKAFGDFACAIPPTSSKRQDVNNHRLYVIPYENLYVAGVHLPAEPVRELYHPKSVFPPSAH